ncbi:hypothetical protein VNI00_002201 [Paramarasmius palmivorus]|uniref:Copper transport protein n=1 Tax=Paramarasmius palmivorus TaxID=297713 RepID=A0AAW0E456_9AGAR
MSHDHDMGDMGSMSGMDNSTDSSMSMSHMMMVPYLHFTKGADVLLFKSIVPNSAGAIFGACLIFFVIAIFDRWFHAYYRGVERRFKARTARLQEDYEGSTENLREGVKTAPAPKPKFVLSHELSRAFLQGAVTTIHYLLMLVVMTFNASYIISIILGHAIGEFSFGRLNR